MSLRKHILNIVQILFVSVMLLVFVGANYHAQAEIDTQLPTDSTSITETVDPNLVLIANTDSSSNLLTDDPGISQDTLPASQLEDQNNVNIAADNSLQIDADQTAISGDIVVTNNDNLSNLATGDTTNNIDILNVATNNQSLAGSVPVIYVNTLYGDVIGNMTIDPASLGMPLPGETLNQSLPNIFNTNTLDIAAINVLTNNISQTSNSGSVLAEQNDNIKDIATGEATNQVNVINIANTIVGTGNYFIGMINIFGNLTGNIILPATLIDTLLNNTGTIYGQSLANISNTSNIYNDVTMTALSGQSTVTNNNNIGSVLSGNTSNTLGVFDYSGQHYFTNNTLLIIVNVMGQWLGLLLGSPNTTVATISNSTPNNISSTLPLKIKTNTTISNSINMSAVSGNVNITSNDNVGNIYTGNATNIARILNISNTVINMSDWFGILFINILGNWHGSVATYSVTEDNGGNSTDPTTTDILQTNQVVSFARVFRGDFIDNSAVIGNQTAVLGADAVKHILDNINYSKKNDYYSLHWLIILSTLIAGSTCGEWMYRNKLSQVA